jgi:hypothetical protein
VDARPVLFGRPLLEHLANGVLAAAAHGAPDQEHERELTRSIHARCGSFRSAAPPGGKGMQDIFREIGTCRPDNEVVP